MCIVQQVAVKTVINVCKKLPPDCSSIIMEAVPTLCILLQYDNVKVSAMAILWLIPQVFDSFVVLFVNFNVNK